MEEATREDWGSKEWIARGTTPCLSCLVPLKSLMDSTVDYTIKNVMEVNTLNPSNQQYVFEPLSIK